jgi:hypothetical protein
LSAARIVRDAGGTLVGRTRLQKVAYLAQLAGFGQEFEFEYRHYGPYSEDLARGMIIASGLGLVQEEEQRANWGGKYSIYRATDHAPAADDECRAHFVTAAAEVGAIELELAATAAFLYVEEGIGRTRGGDPWSETAERKPEKVLEGRLNRAKAAYRKLRTMRTPRELPPIA